MSLSSFQLRLREDRLINFHRPAIMGIINITPDSFFNAHLSVDSAVRTAAEMIAAGADILDVGGEATNPHVGVCSHSLPVPSVMLDLELERLIPVITAIRERFDVLISVDTSRPPVMYAAVEAGADIINDQRHLSEPGACEAVKVLQTPVCLMHSFLTPRQLGSEPFTQLLAMIKNDLLGYTRMCLEAGIRQDRIILDPGFGQGHYAKNTAENFYLLAHLAEFTALGYPVLSGWSRKSMIGEVLGDAPTPARLFGSVAVDTIAMLYGAHIIRTHDVRAIVDAAAIVQRVLEAI